MNVLCPDFPMPIITDRCILRPTQIEDGKMMHEAVLESFSELHYFMHWAKEKPSLPESEAHAILAAENWLLKKNDEPYLALIVLDKITRKFIGAASYHHYNWGIPSVEIGYWIRASESGKGLMTEVITAMTQYAFKQLSVQRIAITCDPDNIKSKNIPERLGYVLEGRLKNHRIKPNNGKVGDTLIYAKYGFTNHPSLNVSE